MTEQENKPLSGDEEEVQDKGQEFFNIIQKQKSFVEELMQENERLRFALAKSESGSPTDDPDSSGEGVSHLRKKIGELEESNAALEARFQQVEEENKDFAQRYVEIEEQNNNLANLYVASYQLHSTLDFQEVISIVQEIVINLVGAEKFAIFLLDEKTMDLGVIAWEGFEEGKQFPRVNLSDGVIGGVAKTGEPFYINEASDDYVQDLLHPIACIPLKIKEHVIGVISINNLLVQKDSFSAVDYELFTLLAGHAATAIFSSRLYSQSERKLMTIQGFLDLLTTQSSS